MHTSLHGSIHIRRQCAGMHRFPWAWRNQFSESMLCPGSPETSRSYSDNLLVNNRASCFEEIQPLVLVTVETDVILPTGELLTIHVDLHRIFHHRFKGSPAACKLHKIVTCPSQTCCYSLNHHVSVCHLLLEKPWHRCGGKLCREQVCPQEHRRPRGSLDLLCFDASYFLPVQFRHLDARFPGRAGTQEIYGASQERWGRKCGGAIRPP